MLREGSHADTVALVELSTSQLEVFSDDFEQGGFTDTVCTQQGDFACHVDSEVDILHDVSFLAIAEVTSVNSNKWRSELLRNVEHEHSGGVFHDLLHFLEFLQILDSRLDQRCSLGVISELVDKLLDVTHLLLLSIECFLLLGFGLLYLLLEEIIITVVVSQLLVVEVDDVCANTVQEVSSMGHNQ